MTLNCIAVDDEPLALGLVGKFIEQTPFLTLVGKYASAVAALHAIHTQKINLVFLDIQMPDLNGMELARVLDKGADRPRVVFTTAYHQFALEGYRVDALDYLLKPFNYQEFFGAANKALHYAGQQMKGSAPSVVNETDGIENDHIFLKVEYQLLRIALDDILYFEGLKDYVRVTLKTPGKSLLSLTSLKALEEKLTAKRFMRVHRSFIVSLKEISSMTKNSIRIGNKLINIGDQYKDDFSAFTAKWL